MKIKPYRWISMALIIGTTTIGLAGLPTPSEAMEVHRSEINGQPQNALVDFERRVANIWGSKNVWTPRPKVWVQYETDLGERSAVDFEKGVAYLQILIKSTDDPHREIVLAHLRQGLNNLILGEAKDPVEMINSQRSTAQKNMPAAAHPAEREIRVYLVRQGDSLWKIARRFRMTTEAIAKINGLATDEILPVGRPIKVMVFSYHGLTPDSIPRPPAKAPLLLDQIRMVDGRPVPHWMVRDFVAEVVDNQPPGSEKVVGADGIERRSALNSTWCRTTWKYVPESITRWF